MERSNEELIASIVAHQLVIDAVENVIEKEELPTADEEHVIECLYPTSIGTDQIELLCGDAENKLKILSELPRKREIPGLKNLVEKHLNQTFCMIEKLDQACGFTGNLINEQEVLASVTQNVETSSKLVAESDKLIKRSKTMSQLVKESVDPVVESASALKSELLENISELRQLEDSLMEEKFRDVPTEVLERLVNDLEEEVREGEPSESGIAEETEEKVAAALKLEEINKELALKKALLETFFSGNQ